MLLIIFLMVLSCALAVHSSSLTTEETENGKIFFIGEFTEITIEFIFSPNLTLISDLDIHDPEIICDYRINEYKVVYYCFKDIQEDEDDYYEEDDQDDFWEYDDDDFDYDYST